MRNWAQQGKLGSTDARESPDGPTQSTREREDWSRGITQCCLLTLLNRQDVPERILYASVDLRPLDRPREERHYVVGARARSWHLVCRLEPRETRSRTSSGCRVESSGVILTKDATRRR
eukprot:tig00000498_g1609.t1